MVDNIKLDKISAESSVSTSSKYGAAAIKAHKDEPLFAFAEESSEIQFLNDKLAQVESNNGAIKNVWNNFKEEVGIGTSSDKCDDAIKQYKKGKISFEEANAVIDEYGSKQDSSLNLFSNIATSVAAIGASTLLTGVVVAALPIALPAAVVAVGIGAVAGAITKVGFKLFDRATNKVEGDALDAKQILKDGASGAVTGGLATYSMGNAAHADTFKLAVKGCGRTGVKTGAISGAANYGIDCAFDENKQFDAKELAVTTAQNAAVSGAVGVIMGGVNYQLHADEILHSGCDLKHMVDATGNYANLKNVAANSVCTAEYKILNDRIRNIAA